MIALSSPEVEKREGGRMMVREGEKKCLEKCLTQRPFWMYCCLSYTLHVRVKAFQNHPAGWRLT